MYSVSFIVIVKMCIAYCNFRVIHAMSCYFAYTCKCMFANNYSLCGTALLFVCVYVFMWYTNRRSRELPSVSSLQITLRSMLILPRWALFGINILIKIFVIVSKNNAVYCCFRLPSTFEMTVHFMPC